MKKKLSVRDFQNHINSGASLDFRAWNLDWGREYPSDQKKARKIWQIAHKKMSEEAFAEAMLLCDGDVVDAEAMLIEQLIPPPSFTALSDCSNCGILPSRQPSKEQLEQGILPSCAWCGIISSQEP